MPSKTSRFRKAVPIQDQADDDLFAIGTLVARVAPLGLGVRARVAFKIRGREVVQIHRVIEIEQRLFSLGQLALNLLTIRMQPVQIPIQRILVQGGEVCREHVRQRRPANPRRHGMLGARTNQPVQGHRFAQRTGARGQARAAQNRIHAQLLPDLMPRVHRAGLPRLLHVDAIRIDRDGRSRSGDAGARQALSHLRREIFDRHRGFWEGPLSLQRGLELVCQREPRVGRCRLEAPQRTDGALAGAVGRVDGFDEQMIGVGFLLVAARRFADIHSPL